MNGSGVIIGVGSDYGPDRIGLDVVAALESELVLQRRGVSLRRCRAPAVDLRGMLHDVPWALLIDALRAGGRAGSPRCLRMDELADDVCAASSHGLGVSATLALLDLLGELPPVIRIVGIEVGEGHCAPDPRWIKAGTMAVHAELERLGSAR